MIRLAYIASPSFSGSTLLTLLLHRHPALATVGELKWKALDLETYACSCGALLRRCPFWADLRAQLEAEGLAFDLARPPTDFRARNWMTDRVLRARVRGPMFEAVRDGATALLPAARETWPAVRLFNRRLIETVLERERATVFLDASKSPVRLHHLIKTGDYEVFVLQLVRDGRGVVASAMRNAGQSPLGAAIEWRDTYRQIERIGRRLGPGRVLRLRYEDLCLRTEATLRRVVDFLGLPPAPPAGVARPHHVLGNRMRLAPGPIALDERWRTELKRGDLAAFERVAGAMNQSYGYV